MDLRKAKRRVGRLLLSAVLASGIFLGTHSVAQAVDASPASETVATTDDGSLSTTHDPVWT